MDHDDLQTQRARHHAHPVPVQLLYRVIAFEDKTDDSSVSVVARGDASKREELFYIIAQAKDVVFRTESDGFYDTRARRGETKTTTGRAKGALCARSRE